MAHPPDLMQLSRSGGDDGFVLPLAGEGEFVCEAIVRRVPGRRLVCRGTWRGEAVYAKLFLGRDARRYARRDADGVRALLARAIATPELLLERDCGEAQVLLYRAIADSRNAEAVWHDASPAQRRQLALALVRLVARQHAAGLLQTDLYLRNFLCQGDTLYTLDGDGIRARPQPRARAESLGNLALLLSKFDLETLEALPELWAAYAAARGWRAAARLQHALATRIARARRRVAQGYADRKVLRNCTDVAVTQDGSHFLAVMRARQTAELAALLADPDACLAAAGSQLLKRGNTCTVALVRAGERQVVVKRYNIKDFWHGVNRALRRTRASISWSNAHLLGMYGIPTAPPLALLERRWGLLRRQSYFFAEYVEGPDLAEYLADPVVTPAEKRAMALKMAHLLYALHQLAVEHGDMKATNLRIVEGRPLLIDLDGLRQHEHGSRFEHRHARDLRRFLKNWHNAPDLLRLVSDALVEVYGSHPVLRRAGIAPQATKMTSETT